MDGQEQQDKDCNGVCEYEHTRTDVAGSQVLVDGGGAKVHFLV